MIDFRYHLVSIVAVFLALAIGIVLGAEAISPRAASTLYSQVQHAAKNNQALYAQNAQLKQQLAADDLVAQAASGYALSHLLQDEQVVLVTAPGADSQTIGGITSALHQAGATVTGQVSLTPQFFDISKTTESNLVTLSRSLAAQAGISLAPSAAAGQIYGQQAAAQVIAAAIVHSDGPATMTSGQSQAILDGFGPQGFLQVSGASGGTTLTGQATLAVVVIPATPTVATDSPANLALVSVARELQRDGAGALLAGSLPGSGTGSAIDAVTSGAAGVVLTTVDNANTASGQIIVIWALRQMLNAGASPTAYGVVPAAVPTPVPTTPPSPSPSPASTRPTRKHPVKS